MIVVWNICFVRVSKKYLAHDELEECNIGDQVLVEECRPLSKRKRWKLIKILSKSSLIS